MLDKAPAQQPTPPMIIVQAAGSAASDTPSAAASPAQNSDSIRAALKVLQEIKAANDEMLKRQEAALQQLEEMQKAADQLRIFARRTGG